MADDNSTVGVRDDSLGGSLLVINILIILLNALTVVVIYRIRNKKAIDLFIFALAMSDLTKGAVPVPLTVYIYLTNWYLEAGSFWCDFYGYMGFATNSGSMLILTLMAIERFLAIVKPFFYRTYVNHTNVRFSVCLCMVFTIFQSALPLMGVGRMLPYYKGAYCHFDYSTYSRGTNAYSIFILAYGLGMIAVVFVCYGFVFYKIRHLIYRHRRMINHARCQLNLKTEKMFSYLTVVLMLLFWFSWLPFLMLVLSQQLGAMDLSENVDLYAMRVVVVNSMLNPIAYATLCKPYRRGVMYLFRKLFSGIGFKSLDSDVLDPWRRNSVVRGPRKNMLMTPNNRSNSDLRNSVTDSGISEYSRSRLPSVLETYEDFRKKRLSVLAEDLADNKHLQSMADNICEMIETMKDMDANYQVAVKDLNENEIQERKARELKRKELLSKLQEYISPVSRLMGKKANSEGNLSNDSKINNTNNVRRNTHNFVQALQDDIAPEEKIQANGHTRGSARIKELDLNNDSNTSNDVSWNYEGTPSCSGSWKDAEGNFITNL